LWFHNLNISSLDIVRCASYFGIGFIAGILCKRWSKYIILLSIFLAIMLALLHSLLIIKINFVKIQHLMGFENIKNIHALFIYVTNMLQKNAGEVSCSGIGFIIGFKTG
jgi:uncharacterized membrane protein (Fun14 family)